ncbi:hypothetical protein V2J09_019918 [Rumex salicifolius]
MEVSFDIVSMDATTSGTPIIQCCIAEQPLVTALPPSSLEPFQRQVRHCFGESTPGEFPLAASPSIVLHATCSFFRHPANFAPEYSLSIAELAALDLCRKRAIFRPMSTDEQEDLKRRCGGSWKLVLRYLMAGEVGSRREKAQAVAGPGHSIVLTSKGQVYSFGSNTSGQLGHGPTTAEADEVGAALKDEFRPRLIRSLQGIRIIQAAVGAGRTMLVSDTGRVYYVGKEAFAESEYVAPHALPILVNTPRMLESLRDTFVVQVAMGKFFTAVLSREGRVFTFSWGKDEMLGHQTDMNDVHPHPLLGDLEEKPVVQIAAGYCFLLALVCEPSGMSLYSVGCGLGGKLGHGSTDSEKKPRLIEEFRSLKMQPWVISAGDWHSAVVGKDGRVCTWGWGVYGCLGHGHEEYESVPKVVEALSGVKAVHVATGDYTTFVVSDSGKVYSFGCDDSPSLGQNNAPDEQGDGQSGVLKPELVELLKDPVVHVSSTNSVPWSAHTFALTKSGKLYAFGAGENGQLGVKLDENQIERWKPELVDIDLS